MAIVHDSTPGDESNERMVVGNHKILIADYGHKFGLYRRNPLTGDYYQVAPYVKTYTEAEKLAIELADQNEIPKEIKP